MKDFQKDKNEKDVKYLEEMEHSKGNNAAVFALKEKVLGKKKTGQEQVIIIDPATGKEVHKPDEIKKVSLNTVQIYSRKRNQQKVLKYTMKIEKRSIMKEW